MPRLKTPRLVTGTRIAVASELSLEKTDIFRENKQTSNVSGHAGMFLSFPAGWSDIFNGFITVNFKMT